MNTYCSLPHEASNAISHNLCHGCGLCAMQCPTKALVMERQMLSEAQCRNSPVFIPQLCVHCGRCAAVCPAGTIFEYRSEHVLHSIQAEGIRQVVFVCDALNSPPAHLAYGASTHGQEAVPPSQSLIAAQKIQRLQDAVYLPPLCHLEVVRCTGRLGARFFLRLALVGVYTIVIFACPPTRCHYGQGRPAVLEQVAAFTSMQEDFGIATMQITVVQQPIGSAAELQAIMRKYGVA